MRPIWKSMTRNTREATSCKTAEPVKQDSKKEDKLNKSVDRVVSKERLALDNHVAKKEKSVIVNAANVKDTIVGISYLTEDGLATIMTPGLDNDNPMEIFKWLQWCRLCSTRRYW